MFRTSFTVSYGYEVGIHGMARKTVWMKVYIDNKMKF